MFPKIPKQRIWYASLFGMQIQIGTMPFMELTKMWTLGGIITTLNILIYSWLSCTFLISQANEKDWTQERITLLKAIAVLALLLIGFTLTSQLVLADGNDDIRQMKTSTAVFVGIVLITMGLVFTVPRNREERHQISRPLRIPFMLAIIFIAIAAVFCVFASYNWYKAAANCECKACYVPCACSYPDCTNRTEH